MKPKSLKRSELHEMVWAQPRSKLSLDWGISDVAIGKLCVRENIPAPLPGYWAKKAAGARIKVAPLPMRLPGQREIVDLQRVDPYVRWNEPVDLDVVISPPYYAESIEEVVNEALARLGSYRAQRDLSKAHPGLVRVLKAEVNRAEKYKARSWSIDGPRYVLPRLQRQLRIFSSVFLILDPIRACSEVREGNTWVQGLGHIHYLIGSVGMGNSRLHLQFLEPEHPKNCRDLPRSAVTTLRVSNGSRSIDFADDGDQRIESRLEEVIKTTLELAEEQMRSVDQANYQRKLERREQLLEEIAEKKRSEEVQRLAEVQARKTAIRNEIGVAAENLRRANDIRQLVEQMAGHPDSLDDGRERYLQWASVALAEAETLDPMTQPFSMVFSAWQKW